MAIRTQRDSRLPKHTLNPNSLLPESSTRQVVLLVPVCNPGPSWHDFLQALRVQSLQPQRVVVIDSASDDGAPEIAEEAGLLVHRIERADFNHGTTRQEAVDQFAADADVVVFMTQDAFLADPMALQHLVVALDNHQVGAAYGRQLPHANATPVAAHARLFNYASSSHSRSWSDVHEYGIKTCFLSNSFAAYSVKALREVGGFPDQVILGEDMHLAARLLKAGYAIRYQAQAIVYHSHNYSMLAEFRRYFDTGVFHAKHHWLTQDFGGAGREGLRFVHSEMRYILKHAPWLLPEVMCRTVLKALGYRLGRRYESLSNRVCSSLSMHKGYWV